MMTNFLILMPFEKRGQLPRWHSLPTLILVCALVLTTSGFAAERNDTVVIEELPYGEILFDFFQQEYFRSLINLLKSDEQAVLDIHKNEAEHLKGGLFLSYGMQSAAEQRLNNAFDSSTNAGSIRNNRAQYYLGKMAYQRGDDNSAQAHLAAINGQLPQELTGRDKYINALINMRKQQFQEVIDELQGWSGDKKLTHYITYNLGLAWLETEQAKSGVELLDKLGREKFREEALLALKDKANLSLGLYYLKAEAYADSRRYLDRIRLHGPYSAKGLLASGWVDVKMKAFRPALIPWTELRQRDVLDPFVQEAILVIPYALAESGLNKPSAHAYEEALLIFNAEQQRLKTSMETLKSGDFIEQMLETTEQVEMGWMRELEIEANAPEPDYLFQLFSSHRTQESLKNYRDLVFLQDNLNEWLASMDAFDDMLALRKQRFQSVLPLVTTMQQDDTLASLLKQYSSINDAFISAKDKSELLKFATPEELEKVERLNRLRAKLQSRSDMPAYDYLNQRLGFLSGILFWDIYSALPARIAKGETDLLDVKNEIRLSKNFLSHINRLIRDLPKGFENYAETITQQKLKLKQTLEKLTAVVDDQKHMLVSVVENELDRHYERIETLKVETVFALAQIYDRGTSVKSEQPDDTSLNGEQQ